MRFDTVLRGEMTRRRTANALLIQKTNSNVTRATRSSTVGAARHTNQLASRVAGNPPMRAKSARRFSKEILRRADMRLALFMKPPGEREPSRPRRRRWWSLALLSVGADAQLFEAPVHGAAAEPQGIGGGIDAAAGTTQCRADQQPLRVLEAHGLDARRTALLHVQAQIGCRDVHPARHQDSAFDDVSQLAHVARPVIAAESLQ